MFCLCNLLLKSRAPQAMKSFGYNEEIIIEIQPSYDLSTTRQLFELKFSISKESAIARVSFSPVTKLSRVITFDSRLKRRSHNVKKYSKCIIFFLAYLVVFFTSATYFSSFYDCPPKHYKSSIHTHCYVELFCFFFVFFITLKDSNFLYQTFIIFYSFHTTQLATRNNF